MAAHVLRLSLSLLRGTLRGDARHLRRTLPGLGALAFAVAGVVWGVLYLRSMPTDVAQSVSIIGGAAITGAFLVAPLIGGPEDPLDPRRFAVFGLSPTPLAGTLLLASVCTVPVLALILVVIALSLLWVAQGVALWVAVASAALGLATCVLFLKVAAALAALFLRDRRSRELTGVLLVGLLVVVVPIVVFLASLQWDGEVPSQLREAVGVVAVTPLGAAWAIPWSSIEGTATVSSIVAMLTLVVLTAAWWGLVTLLMTTAERPLSTRTHRGLGWFTVTPGTPAGAIAARSLTYWLRDPRYVVNIVVVPIAAVVTMVPLLVVGVPLSTAVLLPAPLIALFLGWLAHNDLAYDSTALWMHVGAAVRGSSDRMGRLVPVTLIAVPLLAVAIPVSIGVHGRWALLPAMVGVCSSLYLSGLGLSSVSSVLAPYAASRPGDGAFQQPQRTGGAGAQGVVLVASVGVSLPPLWWAWQALDGNDPMAWAALWGGMGIGFSILVLGILIGGRVFERRGSRLMEFVESV